MAFEKATKEKSLLRSALFGPSGSGKTFTALRIATGMRKATGGRIGLIDSERGSASKYADRFDFDVCDLNERDINAYEKAIESAKEAGYKVLVIDSGTHPWQELLGEIDKMARARFGGNKWSAWAEGTPKQRQFVEAILSYPGHVIMTMRSKTEWSFDRDERTGKNRPTRVGLAPEQGKGIEYEFDLLLELTTDHLCTVIKDRTGKFQDRMIEKPGEDFGEELVAWLGEGSDRKPKPVFSTKAQRKQIVELFMKYGVDNGEMQNTIQLILAHPVESAELLLKEDAKNVIAVLEDESKALLFMPVHADGGNLPDDALPF